MPLSPGFGLWKPSSPDVLTLEWRTTTPMEMPGRLSAPSNC